jgi:hypothetical protein
MLVTAVTFWLGGREPTNETIVWTGLVAALVTGLALGTILVLACHSPWVVGVTLLGALVATIVHGITKNTHPDVYMDSYYPLLDFIVLLVYLGVVLVVGAGIGGVCRLIARVRARTSASS